MAYGTHMTHTLNEEIADNVREALHASGVTITTLSATTGISERTLTRRLRGNSDWTTSEIARIAARLGVHVTSLVGPTHDPS